MSKKTGFATILLLLLTILFLLPGVSIAASHRTSPTTKTTNFVFSGLIDQGEGKGTPLIGGLTLTINEGIVKGSLNLPRGLKVPVKGTVSDTGQLSIVFALVDSVAVIHGQGTPSTDGQFTGQFQVRIDKAQIASGIWSAVLVHNPDNELAYAFLGKTQQGPDSNTVYTGAVLLNKDALTGSLNLPTGAVASASVHHSGENMNVLFNFDEGHQFIGQGHATGDGFAGRFIGPAKDDGGTWTAFKFGFGE